MVVDVTRAQFPTFNETTIPTMSGVINSLTGGKHTGERKRSLERISTCLLIVTFWGDRSFPSWKLRFLLITPYCFALHRGKLLLGGYFFPFFFLFLELFCYYSCSVRFVRFTEYECEFLEICMLHISPVAVCWILFITWFLRRNFVNSFSKIIWICWMV